MLTARLGARVRFVVRSAGFVAALVAAVLAGGCCGGDELVLVDGSSTVYPITEAVAEHQRAAGGGRVAVGVSGTGGGFRKLCSREIDLSGASRAIKPSERVLCEKRDVELIEVPVAYDGIVVAVHPDATWIDSITVDELKTIWRPEAQGEVLRWNQVRPSWPDRELHLYGPGVSSGTYDYFTKAVVGIEHSSRGDFTSSEDDNVLVQGISTDESALGFFSLAYYVENRHRLRAVAIETPAGPVEPSAQTVADGSYRPLSRPVFVYVRRDALDRRAVEAFVEHYLRHAGELASEAGFVGLAPRAYALALARVHGRVEGSVFAAAPPGVKVVEALQAATEATP